MLQQETPDDFVIATGEQHSVREFVTRAAECLDIKMQWAGTGINEIGVDVNSGATVVKIDSRYFRPSEVDTLLGDASKAHAKLGWRPEHSFDDLVQEMVREDLILAKRDAAIAREGFKTHRYRE